MFFFFGVFLFFWFRLTEDDLSCFWCFSPLLFFTKLSASRIENLFSSLDRKLFFLSCLYEQMIVKSLRLPLAAFHFAGSYDSSKSTQSFFQWSVPSISEFLAQAVL